MKLFRHFLSAAMAVLLFTCGPDEAPEDAEGQISFSIQNISNLPSGGRAEADPADITHALVTIENNSGEVILDREEINVTAFGDGFITDPITLVIGDYNLTEFVLLNDADEVIFATPTAGSDLAYLVENPLPMSFTILEGETIESSPEVIDVTASIPEQYGYFGMNFVIIETFDLMISTLEQNTSGSYYPVEYQLDISSGGSEVTSKSLPVGVSVVKLRSDVADYTLDITTTNGGEFNRSYTVSELLDHDVDTNNPLTILIGTDGGTSVGDPCTNNAECGSGFVCNNGTCQIDANGDGIPDEICGDGIDNDGDGTVDEGCSGTDADGDTVTVEAGDCDDNDPAVNPLMPEVCADGIDNDCDGFVDEGCGTDADGDGVTVEAGDCDDTNASIYPGATEICGDGIDNDCDAQVDEGCGTDVDGDGVTVEAGDCDDTDASIYPGATEVCGDGIDNDCDGTIDENCGTDADGDGVTVEAGDCDDTNPAVYPGAPEICGDGIDNDCNGSDLQGTTYYRDADGDGFGSFSQITNSCTGPPLGFVSNAADCNDFDLTVYPGAPEICDGVDNNCDGSVDNDCLPPE